MTPAPRTDPEAQKILARIASGRELFERSWTMADGAGHRNSRGVIDMDKAERMGSLGVNFALFATPTVTSCRACHNVPYTLAGGAGEMVTNVIVVRKPGTPSSPLHKNRLDDVIVNLSKPPSLFGAGFVEMLARQLSDDLTVQRDGLAPGQSTGLESQGIDFGTLARTADGAWDATGVTGLPATSVATANGKRPPTLQIRPFHQVGAIQSIREFSINAFDFHLGVQAVDRFGVGVDTDRDGVVNELTDAALTDVVLYQATLPIPRQVLPRDDAGRALVQKGERVFGQIGCSDCHRSHLVLYDGSWIFSDSSVSVDLTADWLPGAGVTIEEGKVTLAVYSDFKLHDITDGPQSEDRDPLHLHSHLGSETFFAGASAFLTARLWGVGNRPPYFHNGRHTSLLDAVKAHGGEAAASRARFVAASDEEQRALLGFLGSLRVETEPPDRR